MFANNCFATLALKHSVLELILSQYWYSISIINVCVSEENLKNLAVNFLVSFVSKVMKCAQETGKCGLHSHHESRTFSSRVQNKSLGYTLHSNDEAFLGSKFDCLMTRSHVGYLNRKLNKFCESMLRLRNVKNTYLGPNVYFSTEFRVRSCN